MYVLGVGGGVFVCVGGWEARREYWILWSSVRSSCESPDMGTENSAPFFLISIGYPGLVFYKNLTRFISPLSSWVSYSL